MRKEDSGYVSRFANSSDDMPTPSGPHMQAYANAKNIKIIGDMPIYVGGHSADVWANQRLFELSPSGFPASVSGVPPDAFSATGNVEGRVHLWRGASKSHQFI